MRRKKPNKVTIKQNHTQEAGKLQCSHIYCKHFLFNIMYNKVSATLSNDVILLSDPIPKWHFIEYKLYMQSYLSSL